MSRSVTRTALAMGIALISIATLAAVGHQQRGPSIARRPAVAPKVVAFLGPGRAALNHLRLLDGPPAPTPSAAPSPAASSQPHLSGSAVRLTRPAPRPAAPARSTSVAVGGAALEFSLVNRDRSSNGVATLAWSSALARVAQYRAQDMLNRNYFSHYDPSTGQLAFVELLHLWGIPYTTAGENIAWSTNPSMVGINTMFMNSPGHRANILNSGYHRVGIGVASAGGKTMVVEVFSN